LIDDISTIMEVLSMFASLLQPLKQMFTISIDAIRKHISAWTKPAASSVVLSGVQNLARSKPQLVAENALLRQQLIVLHRTIKRPRCTNTDRALLVLLTSRVRAWKDAMLIVKPDTILRWHRQGFRLFWKSKSKAKSRTAKIPAETIALIQEMAANNRLWGAERIRGELLKLGLHVAKRTVQRYMRQARRPRPSGQTWATFLRNHAPEI
jgi:putative transposase